MRDQGARLDIKINVKKTIYLKLRINEDEQMMVPSKLTKQGTSLTKVVFLVKKFDLLKI